MAARDLEVRLKAKDDASATIGKVADAAEKLESANPEVSLTADDKASGDIDRVSQELNELDGRSVAPTVEVDTKGMDALKEGLGALPGPLGEIAGALGTGGVVAGGVTAIAGGLLEAANSAADLAIEAKTTSELTGDSVEDASRLQAVWSQSGADINDLNDVLLQMNGVLATNPELARQLGVNLEDGATIGQRFVEVIDKLGDFSGTAADKAQLMSQAFGEEGVRQVAKLTSLVGDDLQAALDGVADTRVMSDEDVTTAVEMKQKVAELNAAFQAVAIQVGQDLLPALTEVANVLALISRNMPFKEGETLFGTGGSKQLEDLEWKANKIHGTFVGVSEALDDTTAAAAATTDGTDVLGTAIMGAVDSATAFAGATLDAAASLAEQQAAADELLTTLTGLAQTNQDMLDAQRAAADATFAVRDAQRDFNDQMAEWVELTGPDSEATMQDLAAAMDKTAQSAGKVADAQVDQASETAKANNHVYTAADAQTTWNASMVASARQASGPTRQAIVNYIAAVNKIPPEKVSKILANTDDQSVAAAGGKIDAVADKRREARIVATTDTANASYTLDQLAHDRYVNYIANVTYSGSSAQRPGMAGAIAGPGGEMLWVGERGPELVRLPGGARVFPHAQSVGMAQQSTSRVNVTINTAVIGSTYDVQRAVRRALKDSARINGSRAYR